MVRHQLADEPWELIADVFPPPARTGRPQRNRREVVGGILWILRTGSPWRDLPEEFGPWKTVWDLFDTWNSDGTLDEIRHRLQAAKIEAGRIDAELWCIDGTHDSRGPLCGRGWKQGDPDEPADHALGRSRGGFSTKLHSAVRQPGTPAALRTLAGTGPRNDLVDRTAQRSGRPRHRRRW